MDNWTYVQFGAAVSLIFNLPLGIFIGWGFTFLYYRRRKKR